MENLPFNNISEEANQFWENKLSDCVYNNIPRWNENKLTEQINIETHKTSVPSELQVALDNLTLEFGIPLKSILLAAHCKVISVISGSLDITTGYELENSSHQNDIESNSDFKDNVPFRVEIESENWLNFLKKINKGYEEILTYKDYYASKQKDTSQLYETIFNFSDNPNSKKLNRSSFTEGEITYQNKSAFKTEFFLDIKNQELSFIIGYNSYDFCSEQIESISKYYLNTLYSITADVNPFHEKQSILPLEEQNILLEKFNDTTVAYPNDKTFVQLFESQVSKNPDAIALKFNDAEWSYQQLNEYSNKLANHLIERNLKTEDPVVVVMERNNFWTVAMLGILKAGGVYVPVDPEWPKARKATVINKTKAKFVITGNNEKDLGKLVEENAHKPTLIPINQSLKELKNKENPKVKALPDNLAYIIFTSGSTGEPKGAMIEHKGMLNHLFSKVNDLNLLAEDVIAQNSSQCFDISVWQLISGLLVGAKTVIYSDALILDMHQFLHQVKEDNITILELVPSYMKILLKLTSRNRSLFDNLKYLLVTGEPLKIGLVTSWFNFFTIPLVNAYGPTEASDDITHHFMYDVPEDGLVAVGKPIQNLNIYVVDKFNQLAPLGTKGDVYVSGVGVGRGYIDDLEKTKAVFGTDNFKPHKKLKLYKTGDVGRWTPKGVLHLFGREDSQIKLNGYRIDLGEIEQSLSKQNGITDNAVLLKNKQLHAFLSFDGEIKNEETLIAHLKSELNKNLPHYMIPRKFHVLENLPLTPNGKIDRKALQKL